MSVSTTTGKEGRPAFDIFEGYAICSVLAGLEMADKLSELESPGLTPGKPYDGEPEAAALLRASLRYLTQRGVTREDESRFTLTDYGREISRDRGYLIWLVGGYGEPLRRLDAFLAHGMRYGTDYTRDGRWVANGAAQLGGSDVVPAAFGLLDRLTFGKVLDLGCGNARLLLNVCRRYGAGGVGVDLSPAAVAEAEKEIAAADLTSRVEVVLGDAGSLGEVKGIGEVDLVITFFLLHEILAAGRDVLVRYLNEMSELLRTGANLLIAEVEPPVSDDNPVFTPEFTYVHAMMRQELLPAEGWSDVLSAGGFTVREVLRCRMPGCILLSCENTR